MVGPRLKLGLIPFSRDGSQRVGAFAEALAVCLGTGIDLHEAADYRVLCAAMEQGLVDLAWLPPLSAARAVRGGAAVPAAIAVRSGTTSYMTGLITLTSSPIKTLQDLTGVRAAWVDRESASGYVVIRAALRDSGVSLVSAFSEELFVRSHGDIAKALKAGRADVGATCFNFVSGATTVARAGYEEGGLAHDEVRILGYAGPIPSDIFAVHSRVARQILPSLQAGLVDARPAHVHELAKACMHADGFIRPTTEHTEMLDSLFNMVRSRLSIPPQR
jgi:phosphonate transport system substrate-binding protein